METGGGNTRRTRQNSNITGDPTGPTQIHTQDGASRVEQTDRGPGGAGSSGGHGGAGSSGGHGGAGSSGGHGGAGSSEGHGGAGSSGGHGGAGSSGAREAMAEQGARELGRPWRSRELGRPWWDRLRDRGPSPHLSLFGRSPTTPPQNFLGEAQGYQEPSGAKRTETVKKTVVTDWSNTATAGWLVNTAAAGWGYHNRLAWQITAAAGGLDHTTAGAGGLEGASAGCGPSEPRTAGWLSPRH